MPYNANVGDTLGWVLYKKGEYPLALTILEDSVEKSPSDAEIQFHVGMAHYMMDEEDAARVALQRAVSSSQDFPNKDDARKSLDVLNMNTAGPNAACPRRLGKGARQATPMTRLFSIASAPWKNTEETREKAADTYETALKENPDAVSDPHGETGSSLRRTVGQTGEGHEPGHCGPQTGRPTARKFPVCSAIWFTAPAITFGL